MVSIMDDGIGNVTQALKKAGIFDNTLMIFSSDNGGPTNGNEGSMSNNFPLRGGKNTIWEGGTRVIGAIAGPGVAFSGQQTTNDNIARLRGFNMAPHRDLRCVLRPSTYVPGAGCKTRRESRIKKLNPISFVIDFSGQFTYEKWHATDWLPTLVSMAAGSSWSNFVSKSCTLD